MVLRRSQIYQHRDDYYAYVREFTQMLAKVLTNPEHRSELKVMGAFEIVSKCDHIRAYL